MRLIAPVTTLLIVAALAAPAKAANQPIQQGGSLFSVSLRPLTELRFENVVRQQFDLSCGAAAVATIFKYFYRTNIAEGEIVEAMLKTGEVAEISKRGFSMLEIKRFAESRGFVSEGFRIADAKKLDQLKAPVLTLINTRGYKHFVVLKKVENGRVIIADPAFGNTVKSMEDFEKVWNNVILVILSPTLDGYAQFIDDYSVKSRPREINWLIERGLRTIVGGVGEF